MNKNDLKIKNYIYKKKMEEEYIHSLVIKKDEFRKKLFETFNYCRFSNQLESLQIIFFKNASKLI